MVRDDESRTSGRVPTTQQRTARTHLSYPHDPRGRRGLPRHVALRDPRCPRQCDNPLRAHVTRRNTDRGTRCHVGRQGYVLREIAAFETPSNDGTASFMTAPLAQLPGRPAAVRAAGGRQLLGAATATPRPRRAALTSSPLDPSLTSPRHRSAIAAAMGTTPAPTAVAARSRSFKAQSSEKSAW